MFCPNCGAKNEPSAGRCHKCGFALGEARGKFKGTMLLAPDSEAQRALLAQARDIAQRGAEGIAAPAAGDPGVPARRRPAASTILGVAPQERAPAMPKAAEPPGRSAVARTPTASAEVAAGYQPDRADARVERAALAEAFQPREEAAPVGRTTATGGTGRREPLPTARQLPAEDWPVQAPTRQSFSMGQWLLVVLTLGIYGLVLRARHQRRAPQHSD